jgi:acyl dehydratase
MRQAELYFARRSLHVAAIAVDDIRWLQPVRPGNVILIRLLWGQACRSPACRGQGGRTATIAVTNSSGGLVLRIGCSILLAEKASTPGTGLGCSDVCRRVSRVQRRPGGHLVRYFEDVELGDEVALGSCRFTAAAVRTYGSIIDEQSKLALPGTENIWSDAVHRWHLVSMWTRLIVDYYHAEVDWLRRRQRRFPLLGPAAGARNLSWRQPIRVGDRVAFTSWVEHKVGIGTSRDWGMLFVGTEGINQRGEIVVSFYPQFLLQKRPE